MGWTLGQVDALSVGDFHEFLHVRAGKIKARNAQAKRDKWAREIASKSRGRRR